METREELLQSIELYQTQLDQVNAALSCAEQSEKLELTSLKSNITELLELTKQNLDILTAETSVSENEGAQDETSIEQVSDDDPFAREYAMFKAELDDLDSDKRDECNQNDKISQEDEIIDIQEELNELIGSKCQAPYTDKLNTIHYYNALVFSAHVPDTANDLTQIQVRVMFINPTETEMIPCPYYLDGKCKFSDNKCNFSHGYVVPFSQLHEYKEPDFRSIKSGSHVLAKPPNKQLWISTRIEDVLSNDSVSIKHQGVSYTIPLHDTFPLLSSSHNLPEEDDGDIDDDKDDIYELNKPSFVSDEAVERSLLDPMGVNRKFGEWEQHTKGIGSKLMAKMGYVVGAGLGKSGEGRLDPVQAVILPPGKSLDHCMGLREAAGGSKDLFSVERLQKKLAMKAQRRSAQVYKRKKQEEKNQHNMFSIINNMAEVPKKSFEDFSSKTFKKQLESSSERSLNVEKLKTEETMERMSRDIYVLQDKLTMKKEGTSEHKFILAKLNQAKNELETLQRKNGKIAWEINIRDTKKKMAF